MPRSLAHSMAGKWPRSAPKGGSIQPLNRSLGSQSTGRGTLGFAMTRASGGSRLSVRSFSFSIAIPQRSEEHTSELQSLMRISYAVFCLKKHINGQTTKKHKTQKLIQ